MNSDNWNFDISEAPRGEFVEVVRNGKNGPIATQEFRRSIVIAASSCGKVTKSYFVPDENRWCMFTAANPPIAWRLWPKHPSFHADENGDQE